jgi:hypothetical protein
LQYNSNCISITYNYGGADVVQKTKLGINVGLMGAALYFVGLFNFLGLIVLAGYVLLFESNEWLRRSAVKAVSIVIGFTLITLIMALGNDVFGAINGFLSWFRTPTHLAWPLNMNLIVTSLANALQKIVLFILGVKAFSQGSMAVGPIDRIVDKNM